MKRHFLPVAMLATMMLVGAVLPVYAAENQENEETITRVVVSEKEVQDISSSFLALATEGEAVQSAKTKIAAKEKVIIKGNVTSASRWSIICNSHN